MAWVILISAGVLEAIWAIALKKSDGFSVLWPTVVYFVAMPISMVMLAIALKTLPASVGYAVWTGIGAVGAAALGMTMLGESAALDRILPIGLITTGIVWLALASN